MEGAVNILAPGSPGWPPGSGLLHRIGPETCLWSSDYPHQESTFGYTCGAIEAVFRAGPQVG